MYTVYVHTLPDGRKYVGCTSLDLERRWEHGQGYKNQPLFYSQILEYGWDNIKHEVFRTYYSKKRAQKNERKLIRKLGDNCVNVKCKSANYFKHHQRWIKEREALQ